MASDQTRIIIQTSLGQGHSKLLHTRENIRAPEQRKDNKTFIISGQVNTGPALLTNTETITNYKLTAIFMDINTICIHDYILLSKLNTKNAFKDHPTTQITKQSLKTWKRLQNIL